MKVSLVVGAVAVGLVLSIPVFKYCSDKVQPIKDIPVIKNINFSNYELDLKELSIPNLPNSIWFVSTKNSSFCVSIRFKNAGLIKYRKQDQAALSLIEDTLFDGAGKYTATGLKKLLDDNSIFINIFHNMDDVIVSCYSTVSNFHLAMIVLRDILYSAHLNEKKININRQNQKENLIQSKEKPKNIAEDEIEKLEYGADSPYYVSIDEQIQNLDSCTQSTIKNVYQGMFLPADAVISIAGNLNEDEIKKEILNLFANLKDKTFSGHVNKIQKQRELACVGKIVHKHTKDPQIVVRFSHPAIDITNPDIYALEMGMRILCTGMTSRLFKAIREKQGLTYSIPCGLNHNSVLSKISGSATTSPDKCEQLIKSIKEQFDLIKNITEEELEAQKISMMASDSLTSPDKITSFLSSCRYRSIPINEVNSYMQHYYNLSVNDVINAMKKYISSEKIIFVTVGGKK